MKRIAEATDPDVLCFLEAKTDVENLLKMEGFEDWMKSSNYKFLHCYWSEKDKNARSYGNEGMLIFSKVECERCIIEDEELDQQARTMTMEFKDFILVVSYNPQGGFGEESRWTCIL